jgi:hypothetical protein
MAFWLHGLAIKVKVVALLIGFDCAGLCKFSR